MNMAKDTVEGGIEERKMLESDDNICMDNEQRRAMMNAFTPKGLLPNKVPFLAKELDRERCYKLEKRTALLLNQILPNQNSEQLRNSIVSYLQRLIKNSIPCQVFTFGSVPLKTYLPDGDIDLVVFSYNQDLKDGLVHEVSRVLETERKNKNAEFHVKEVLYIQAKVKILKCLVDKFVVDISFNQISGLCALCFFEEVDNLIGHNHLFKCSIILIKTWCYHESRILGANLGLISTYALEVLVLYIFHIYSDIFPFSGPLEVLFRFLDFFSKFDWNNYIVSLSGPIPISSLPNLVAEPPRNDCRKLLLEREVFTAWKAFYGVKPRSQGPFVTKRLNILDPLCENNNLGLSINKGNLKRIKSAMALGAERIMRLFDCREEKIIAEFDYFFKNTWHKHGNGHWISLHIHNLLVRNNNTSPVNVMNISNFHSPSPPPTPPPPLPGFPPPPGFEHANSYGVPHVNVPSRSYNMPYLVHDNRSQGFCYEKNMDGGSISCNASSWNNSPGTCIVTSSRFSPGSTQRSFDNPRPIFPPTMTCIPLNHMNMNADPTNLNTSLITNYNSLAATSNPCVSRVVPDILKADFVSHLRNLNHGRLCDNPQLQQHFPYFPDAFVPPFHYPIGVASMTHSNFMSNMAQLPPSLHQFSTMSNLFPHQGFNQSVKPHEHKRSDGIATFPLDPVSYEKKMSYLTTNKEASSHASLIDDNSNDTPVISDGTNEASNQGECSQSVSNEMENVADPSSHQPPTAYSPRTQDEHVSIFINDVVFRL